MPAMIVPGQTLDTITVHYGYGRRLAGRVGANIGFDAYPLRSSESLSYDTGVEVVRTNTRYRLATTQQHFLMEDRDIVRAATSTSSSSRQAITWGVIASPKGSLSGSKTSLSLGWSL